MAKILLIQIQPAPYAGTAYLNGAALSSGHKFKLYLSTEIKDIFANIKKEKPDIIGFSAMSGFHKDYLAMARKIKKKFNIPIMIGGPHATLFPDVIKDPSIDLICRGEGEFALIDLLNALENKKPYHKIKNLWVKHNGEIIKNELRPLEDPLDNVPLIDWSCYKGTPALNYPPVAFLIRGCPYSCSYCFNHTMRKMYHGLGKYVRHFSVERSILEIKQALKVFPPAPVLFTSDSFGIDLKWMDELFKEYQKITKLPFVLLLRPELATQDCIDIIAKYKCLSIALGVESGSERVRKEILNRHYSNETLIKIARMLHKKGIKFRSYNMIGLPTETENEMWETISLNIKMKTDFPRGAIFTPMPNTKIVEIAKEYGYLDSDFSFDKIPNSILSRSILKKIDRDKVRNTMYFFQSAIIFPSMRKFIRKLTALPPNKLFEMWFYLIYAYLHRRSEQRKVIPYIKYILSNRKYR